MSKDISTSFKSIGHPIRVQILLILSDSLHNGLQFSEISRELEIESGGKLAFHLEKLSNLVNQNDQGRYILTARGHKAVEAVKLLGVNTSDDITKSISDHIEISPHMVTKSIKTEDKQVDISNRNAHSQFRRIPINKIEALILLFVLVGGSLTGFVVYLDNSTDAELRDDYQKFGSKLYSYKFNYRIYSNKTSDRHFLIMRMEIEKNELSDDENFYIRSIEFHISGIGRMITGPESGNGIIDQRDIFIGDDSDNIQSINHEEIFEIQKTLGFKFLYLRYQVNFHYSPTGSFGTFTSLTKGLNLVEIPFESIINTWILVLSIFLIIGFYNRKKNQI